MTTPSLLNIIKKGDGCLDRFLLAIFFFSFININDVLNAGSLQRKDCRAFRG